MQKANYEETIKTNENMIQMLEEQQTNDKEGLASLDREVATMAAEIDTLQTNYAHVSKKVQDRDNEIIDKKKRIEEHLDKIKSCNLDN